jgi:general secretion pathway protein E
MTDTHTAALLGELLIAQNAISQRDLDKALVAQQQMGGRLGGLLIRSGALSETHLLQALQKQLQLPVLETDIAVPSVAQVQAALLLTQADVSWLLQIEAVIWLAEDTFYCVAEDIFAPLLNEWLMQTVQLPVHFVLARRHILETALLTLRDVWQAQQSDQPIEQDVRQLRELAEEAPVVELVNNLLSMALEERASDIHIEPEEETFDIRYRIDGVLYTRRTLPKQRYYAVASRLKLVSGVDIAERRLPQDGRIGMRINGKDLDVRVSTLPGVHGESIVMRLLPKERADLRLERLGLLPDHLELMRSWAKRPHGIVLVTGPTGSGKSTTLYGVLDEIAF